MCSAHLASAAVLTYLPLYVSGSAYKIVKDRAYHHGTMLISTRLDTLGELLKVRKVCTCYLYAYCYLKLKVT